jgi:hypothetical protein
MFIPMNKVIFGRNQGALSVDRAKSEAGLFILEWSARMSQGKIPLEPMQFTGLCCLYKIIKAGNLFILDLFNVAFN